MSAKKIQIKTRSGTKVTSAADEWAKTHNGASEDAGKREPIKRLNIDVPSRCLARSAGRK